MKKTCFNCGSCCFGYWGKNCDITGKRIPESKTCSEWNPDYECQTEMLRKENKELRQLIKALESTTFTMGELSIIYDVLELYPGKVVVVRKIELNNSVEAVDVSKLKDKIYDMATKCYE